jgi:nitric oxide reductase subunit C
LLAACSATAPTPDVARTEELTPTQSEGKTLFGGPPGNCATCHALDGATQLVGPSLAGIARRAASRMPELDARQYLELSIIKPGAYVVDGFSDGVMPPSIAKQLTSDELGSLVDFLLTLE